MNPADPSRRRLLRAAGASVAATLPLPAQARPEPGAYAFFDARESAFIEAAVARLIPADELGPGALEAGVPQYIDLQLAGPWGAGERFYRSGPWREGEPTQGYQLPFTPAQLFRESLRELDPAFAAKAPHEQDEALKALEKDKPDFFAALLALTIEGFFCDPVHGGNRGMAGWKLVGFPGAYASYYELVGLPDYRFEHPPLAIASHASHRHGKP